MLNTSRETPGWMKFKLESRLPGETYVCVYIYIFFFISFSIMVCHRTLTMFPVLYSTVYFLTGTNHQEALWSLHYSTSLITRHCFPHPLCWRVSTSLQFSAGITQATLRSLILDMLSEGLAQGSSYLVFIPLTFLPRPFPDWAKDLCPCTHCSLGHQSTDHMLVTIPASTSVFLRKL